MFTMQTFIYQLKQTINIRGENPTEQKGETKMEHTEYNTENTTHQWKTDTRSEIRKAVDKYGEDIAAREATECRI
jgi:hypothetical protein